MKVDNVWLCWSSGKDSAWALHVLRQNPSLRVTALVTTVNATFDRVAMHAVRSELLRQQAGAVGLPLKTILIPWPCSNADYEAAVRPVVDEAVQSDVAAMAFGDLFLEDVRAYRERMLDGTGLTPLFPLWGRPTAELAKEMLAEGLKARLTCVDPKVLPRHFAGSAFDAELLADLPAGVDPCGERGEFHSFVTDGPMFHRPIACQSGEIVERDGFVFADLLPVD
jgi:uncharacterized protein (TIGR00290 family)